nr:exocyst complex component EXO70A1-like [Ipomoea batatas]
MDDLRSIAQRLRLMGCLRDCQEIYSAIRKTFFNATLTRFGIGKLSASDVQRMVWQELDMMIGLWVNVASFGATEGETDIVCDGRGAQGDISEVRESCGRGHVVCGQR